MSTQRGRIRSKKLASAKDTEPIHVLTHPLRYKIAKALEASGKPMYIAQIAKHFNKEWDRKLISFHLMALEKFGLVTSDVDLFVHKGRNPVAVRYFKLTDKAKTLLKECNL